MRGEEWEERERERRETRGARKGEDCNVCVRMEEKEWEGEEGTWKRERYRIEGKGKGKERREVIGKSCRVCEMGRDGKGERKMGRKEMKEGREDETGI